MRPVLVFLPRKTRMRNERATPFWRPPHVIGAGNNSGRARAAPWSSPANPAAATAPGPLTSHHSQNFPGWHLWRKIQVVKENCNPPLSVGFLLPDFEVSCTRRDRPATVLGSQGELVPTPVEGQRALHANGDDGDREFGATSSEELPHTVPKDSLRFGPVERRLPDRHITVTVGENCQHAIHVAGVVRLA